MVNKVAGIGAQFEKHSYCLFVSRQVLCAIRISHAYSAVNGRHEGTSNIPVGATVNRIDGFWKWLCQEPRQPRVVKVMMYQQMQRKKGPQAHVSSFELQGFGTEPQQFGNGVKLNVVLEQR